MTFLLGLLTGLAIGIAFISIPMIWKFQHSCGGARQHDLAAN